MSAHICTRQLNAESHRSERLLSALSSITASMILPMPYGTESDTADEIIRNTTATAISFFSGPASDTSRLSSDHSALRGVGVGGGADDACRTGCCGSARCANIVCDYIII